MSNLIKAIINIIDNPSYSLTEIYESSNRINNRGDALEFYVKDIFCNTLLADQYTKNLEYQKNFSYLGNKNNPPDIILKNGDAVEIKKLESISSAIALNSSYPKNRLYVDDPRIIKSCKECEIQPWDQKDILYVIGSVDKNNNKIKFLSFVYGDCYCADREIYLRISDKISQGIKEIGDIEFWETNEIAKVKKVDPLGITDLRVRGMWHIENPLNVFYDSIIIKSDKEFNFNAIMLKEKYDLFPLEDRVKLESIVNLNLIIKDIKIKCPNNPAQLLKAKLISYAN